MSKNNNNDQDELLVSLGVYTQVREIKSERELKQLFYKQLEDLNQYTIKQFCNKLRMKAPEETLEKKINFYLGIVDDLLNLYVDSISLGECQLLHGEFCKKLHATIREASNFLTAKENLKVLHANSLAPLDYKIKKVQCSTAILEIAIRANTSSNPIALTKIESLEKAKDDLQQALKKTKIPLLKEKYNTVEQLVVDTEKYIDHVKVSCIFKQKSEQTKVLANKNANICSKDIEGVKTRQEEEVIVKQATSRKPINNQTTKHLPQTEGHLPCLTTLAAHRLKEDKFDNVIRMLQPNKEQRISSSAWKLDEPTNREKFWILYSAWEGKLAKPNTSNSLNENPCVAILNNYPDKKSLLEYAPNNKESKGRIIYHQAQYLLKYGSPLKALEKFLQALPASFKDKKIHININNSLKEAMSKGEIESKHANKILKIYNEYLEKESNTINIEERSFIEDTYSSLFSELCAKAWLMRSKGEQQIQYINENLEAAGKILEKIKNPDNHPDYYISAIRYHALKGYVALRDKKIFAKRDLTEEHAYYNNICSEYEQALNFDSYIKHNPLKGYLPIEEKEIKSFLTKASIKCSVSIADYLQELSVASNLYASSSGSKKEQEIENLIKRMQDTAGKADNYCAQLKEKIDQQQYLLLKKEVDIVHAYTTQILGNIRYNQALGAREGKHFNIANNFIDEAIKNYNSSFKGSQTLLNQNNEKSDTFLLTKLIYTNTQFSLMYADSTKGWILYNLAQNEKDSTKVLNYYHQSLEFFTNANKRGCQDLKFLEKIKELYHSFKRFVDKFLDDQIHQKEKNYDVGEYGTNFNEKEKQTIENKFREIKELNGKKHPISKLEGRIKELQQLFAERLSNLKLEEVEEISNNIKPKCKEIKDIVRQSPPKKLKSMEEKQEMLKDCLEIAGLLSDWCDTVGIKLGQPTLVYDGNNDCYVRDCYNFLAVAKGAFESLTANKYACPKLLPVDLYNQGCILLAQRVRSFESLLQIIKLVIEDSGDSFIAQKEKKLKDAKSILHLYLDAANDMKIKQQEEDLQACTSKYSDNNQIQPQKTYDNSTFQAFKMLNVLYNTDISDLLGSSTLDSITSVD